MTLTGSGTITVNGSPVISGSASSPISISDGLEKTITVQVTQGGNFATYTINVRKIITTHTGTATVTEGISGGFAWRVHRFTSGSGTYNSNIPVTAQLLVGGGPYSGGGGNAGQYVYNASYALTTGNKSITIGSGGYTTNIWPRTRISGTASSFDTVSASGGITGLEGYSNGSGGANGLGVAGQTFAQGVLVPLELQIQ